MARLSALRTGRLQPHETSRLLVSVIESDSTTEPHCGRREGLSQKYPNDPIGNRIRDLPACIAVRQTAAPLRHYSV